jgi:ABC-type lipoprotein release transport system permease subunit
VHSLLAGWRVSLHRTRADWPIVAAAWLITFLAAVLLAAGPVYSSAASVAGLRRTLADAPAADTSIQVSSYGAPADVAAMDGPARAELQRAIAPVGGSIVRYGRSSETFSLRGPRSLEADDRATLGFLDGLSGHAKLVDGGWPAQTTGRSEPIQVVVLDAVAEELRLRVGDELSLVAKNFDKKLVVPVRLVGIFAIGAVADPYWYGDQQLMAGIENKAGARTLGPFLTTPDEFLQRAGVISVHMRWRTFPDLQRLTLDDSAQLRSGLEALPERLQVAIGGEVDVTTALPTIVSDAERSLLVSRTGVLLLLAQLAILAVYAIILTASLLVDRRRIDTALLRSRGAGPMQVALLALAEGLFLAIPAVLVAPWLAVAALTLFNLVGPLADVGLRIVPRVTLDAYLSAGAIGLVCVVLLVLPALLAARGFAAEQRGLSRQETRTFGQRMGLDVALVAVSAIALWQLRLYGAPLTRTVQGSLGLDPLLVAAPAIGLLAGGVLALRILPLVAQRVEAAVSRGQGLVASLGSRQLARRPLRYTRSALLLMLAMSMGVFALSYTATWSTSQRDQATYQAGADVRVLPGHSLNAPPAWSLPDAYAGLASVERASPVERIADGVSFAAGTGDLLAVDADAASGIVLIRGDESARPFSELMQALQAGRPQPRLGALPEGATYLRIVPRVQISGFGAPLDPAALSDVSVSADAILRDRHGLIYRIKSDPVPMTGSETAIVLQLGTEAARRDYRLDGPVELAGLAVDVSIASDQFTTGRVLRVASISAGDHPNGPWTDVPVTGPRRLVAMVDNEGGVLPTDVTFLPDSIASIDQALPVIANRAFLVATASAAGDTISATVEGANRRLSIVAAVDAFPTADPGRPLLVVDGPTLGLLRLQARHIVRNADEWWIAATLGDEETLTAELLASPFDSAAVMSVVDRTRSLSTDGVALSIIGALTLGSVAAALFAIVGLTVSAAVSARERRTEFALLRALGLSGRQLSGWLWLENGSLVFVSLLAGTGLGILIGWMVLPFATVTQRAATPVPSVIVQVPWDRILLLEVLSALTLTVAVALIGGALRRLGMGSILRMGED